jgi:hypothetical protein
MFSFNISITDGLPPVNDFHMLRVTDLSQNANLLSLSQQTVSLSRAIMSIFTCRDHAAPPPQIFKPAVIVVHPSFNRERTIGTSRGRVEDQIPPLSPWREASRPP